MVSIHLIGIPVLTVLYLDSRAAAGSGDAPPPGLHLDSCLKQHHLQNQRTGLHSLADNHTQVLIPDAQLCVNLFNIAHMQAFNQTLQLHYTACKAEPVMLGKVYNMTEPCIESARWV